jgi:PAS domain S-box-containing protein
METVGEKRFYSTPSLYTLIYLIVGLLWLQIIIQTVIRLWAQNISFFWMELVFDTLFATLLTLVLFYFHKKINTDIASRTREQIKLFKKNPYPMWVYDLNTLRFMTVNDAAIALYGYTEAEFLSMTIKDIMPPEDVPSLITEVDQVKLNFNHTYHWSGTWRHKMKNERQAYVEISSHEIIFEGKKAELVLAYNVTEKVMQDKKLQALNQELEWKVMNRTNDLLQLNRRLIDQNKIIKSANLELFTITSQLQEANQKIQEHADLKNKFVSMASHEFRTPLANISFSAGFIRRNFEKLDAPAVMGKVQTIETQVAHMVSLLDDVLTIGKADAVKLEVNIGEIDIANFANKIVQEVQNANDGSHTIHLNIHDDVSAIINTDEKFLRNIFVNLLSNAIKYSPASFNVYFSIYRVNGAVCFEVKDNGLGISALDLEKIFDPFYRSNPTQNISGTGLGLSIVKRAADLLNAKIKVESKFGEGSTFRVILPII